MSQLGYYDVDKKEWIMIDGNVESTLSEDDCDKLLTLLNQVPEQSSNYKTILYSLAQRQGQLESQCAAMRTQIDIIDASQHTVENNVHQLYYQGGDTIEVSLHTAGVLTTSKTEVRFVIPISKPCFNVSNIYAANVQSKVRQENKYLLGTAADWGVPTTLVFTPLENHIAVEMIIPAHNDAINNDAVAIALNCTLILE